MTHLVPGGSSGCAVAGGSAFSVRVQNEEELISGLRAVFDSLQACACTSAETWCEGDTARTYANEDCQGGICVIVPYP